MWELFLKLNDYFIQLHAVKSENIIEVSSYNNSKHGKKYII